MRYVMFGGTCLAITILFMQMILVVDARFARKEELDLGVLYAMNRTMWRVQEGDIRSEIQLKEYLEERISEQISSDTQVTVQIDEIMMEEGLLKVTIFGKYVYPNGKNGGLRLTRTAIIDGCVEAGDEE